jgi:hypothetical protein
MAAQYPQGKVKHTARGGVEARVDANDFVVVHGEERKKGKT